MYLSFSPSPPWLASGELLAASATTPRGVNRMLPNRNLKPSNRNRILHNRNLIMPNRNLIPSNRNLILPYHVPPESYPGQGVGCMVYLSSCPPWLPSGLLLAATGDLGDDTPSGEPAFGLLSHTMQSLHGFSQVNSPTKSSTYSLPFLVIQ